MLAVMYGTRSLHTFQTFQNKKKRSKKQNKKNLVFMFLNILQKSGTAVEKITEGV